MDGFFSLGRYEPRGHLCDCGCGVPVDHNGLVPRFAGGSCRDRWIADLSIHGQPAPESLHASAVLAAGPQEPLPPSPQVETDEVVAVHAEFAERITVASTAEAVLRSVPSGMWVQPSPRSLWKTLRGLTRKVW